MRLRVDSSSVAALYLGKREGKDLVYMDKVGTGCLPQTSKADAVHADYWTDQAIDWLQRAAQTSRKAVAYEVRDGRMIQKSGNQRG